MSAELVCVLLAAGAPEAEVEMALSSALERGRTLPGCLADENTRLSEALDRELVRREVPSLELVRPLVSQVSLLPVGLCERLGVVPVHKDARSGRVDVAALDPLDPHLTSELEFHLAAPVRVLFTREDALKEALSVLGPARVPSGPPLPLVRKAPQTGALSGDSDGDEPVLSLSRPKSTDRKITQPIPAEAAPTEPTPTDPTPTERTMPQAPEPMAELAFLAERAVNAEELVALLLRGMAPAPSLVLSVRSGVYSGRAASPGLSGELARKLRLPAGAPSVIETAVRSGFYLGILPMTPAHAPLRDLFGGADEHEVYVAPVLASGHPSLILVSEVKALGPSVEATRRADQLALMVARALERILVSKKRGG